MHVVALMLPKLSPFWRLTHPPTEEEVIEVLTIAQMRLGSLKDMLRQPPEQVDPVQAQETIAAAVAAQSYVECIKALYN